MQWEGGDPMYQCGVVGSGKAAVFKGRGDRFITTVDVNTTQAHLIMFNYLAGTISDVSFTL